jgi:hypothetical protein
VSLTKHRLRYPFVTIVLFCSANGECVLFDKYTYRVHDMQHRLLAG